MEHKILKQAIALLLIVMLPSQLVAQKDAAAIDAYFEIFSAKDGLSQNDVTCIIQDSYGFIWLGTNGGVNRFDGYNFKVFQKEVGNTNSLSSNLISSIIEDSHGNIWIGTNDAGITFYDRSANKMAQIKNSSSSPNVITNNHIVSMQEASDGRIWVGTINGLNVIQVNDNKSFDIEHIWADVQAPFSLRSNHIFKIFMDPFDDLWFGTSSGLYRYDIGKRDSTHRFIQYELPLSPPRITDITKNDSALVISNVQQVLLLPFGEIYKTNPSTHDLNNISGRKICVDKNGNIWGVNATGARLMVSNKNGLVYSSFSNDLSNPNSLSRNQCLSIFSDSNGIIWIGTSGGGVNMFNPLRKKFRHYFETLEKGSLPGSKMRSIKEDQLGNLWVATEGGGLNFHKKRPVKAYESGFEKVELEGREEFVFALEESQNTVANLMFVGTDHPGFLHIVQYNEKTQKLSSQAFEGHDIEGIVMWLYHDSNNFLWVGTYADGLHRIKLDRNGKLVSFNHMKYDPSNNKSTANVIRCIKEDPYGNLWIGTERGLHKLTREEKYKESPSFIRYQYNVNDSSSIGYDYVIPIHISTDGTIWVGTIGGGLNKVIRGVADNDDSFQRFNVSNGLIDNNVKSIEEDKEGNLWLGTNKGIVRFDPSREEYDNFGIGDGLHDWEFTEVASETLRNGEMLFGSVNGFVNFKPGEIIKDTTKAPLVITDFKILDKSINPQEHINGRVLLERNINDLEKIKLKHKENSFSVEFAITHFASPENNQYSFMLEGFDDDWINVSSDVRMARYTNVPAGEYTLKMKASNGDLFWNENPIKLDIEIAPPVWASIYAKTLYLIMIILCLWFFRKYTVIKNSRKNQLLIDHLEKEKIEELNQLKFRFFTNVSHEFRTPLTLILGLTEQLRKSKRSLTEGELKTYYSKIHRNTHILLNLINQLLDFRKVEQGKMPIKVSKGKCSTYIKSLCDNFNEVARKKRIDFQFVCHEVIVGYYDKEILERVLFNLLSNAFKFTPNDGEITVTLDKDDSGKKIELEVKDSGVGMSKTVQEHLFERFSDFYPKKESGSGIGLAYTKGLIELYHGSISFVSKENEGTTFSVILPIEKEAFLNDEITQTDFSESEEYVENKEVNWLIDSGEETDIKNKELVEIESRETILLVEDNQDILFSLTEYLKDRYKILTAQNGEEALEKCVSERVDLVISDIMMPVMDGMEFCKKLKNDNRINHILVILITAKASNESKLSGYETGADAYIVKPFELRELDARMEALLASRRSFLKKFNKGERIMPSEIKITSLDEKFLSRALSYVEKNIGNSEYTVEMFARDVGMSSFHLNKKLKVLVGQTTLVFIRNIRIQRARQLFDKNRFSVNEVMYEVGFLDPKYFRNCFKKEFGMTPADYSRNQKGIKITK